VGFEREGFGACGMGKENGGGGVKGERERERERDCFMKIEVIQVKGNWNCFGV
jgi:hypothetical protein